MKIISLATPINETKQNISFKASIVAPKNYFNEFKKAPQELRGPILDCLEAVRDGKDRHYDWLRITECESEFFAASVNDKSGEQISSRIYRGIAPGHPNFFADFIATCKRYVPVIENPRTNLDTDTFVKQIDKLQAETRLSGIGI